MKMAASTELDNFIQKFRQLWSAGHSAHLDIGTHAGQAWVGLRVELGASETFIPHPPPKSRKSGPSRIRRRNRRAAARAAMDVVNGDVHTEEVGTVQGPSEDTAACCEPTEEVVQAEIPSNELATVENAVEADNCTAEIVKVCGIATLENCPDEQLGKIHSDSIRSFLFKEQHLLENVRSSKLEHLSSRSFRSGKYVHTISVTLSVKALKLQENATEYIKKYLGQQNWRWDNGTEMRLSKIHEKKEPG